MRLWLLFLLLPTQRNVHKDWDRLSTSNHENSFRQNVTNVIEASCGFRPHEYLTLPHFPSLAAPLLRKCDQRAPHMNHISMTSSPPPDWVRWSTDCLSHLNTSQTHRERLLSNKSRLQWSNDQHLRQSKAEAVSSQLVKWTERSNWQ